MKKNIAFFCIIFGFGVALMDYGSPGTISSALGSGIYIGTFFYALGWILTELIPSYESSRSVKNTQRIYEIEEELGIDG